MDIPSFVALVVVALITSIVAPSVLARRAARQAEVFRVEDRTQAIAFRQEDWDRQDTVAAQAAQAAQQAAKAADLLLLQQEDAAQKTAAVAHDLLVANERVAKTSEDTIARLDVIHTLVNSQMTASMQNELNLTMRQRTMMEEIIRLNSLAGSEPSPESLAAVTTTQAKIEELTIALGDRLTQSRLVLDAERSQPQPPT